MNPRPPAKGKPRPATASTHQAHKPTRVLNVRARAIDTLSRVLDGKSLNAVLPAQLEQTVERDRGLLNELVMGSCRQWFALESIIAPMMSKAPKPILQAALILGAYQIFYTRIPAHAAISETVDAVKQLGQVSAAGLVNAILRRILREQDTLTEPLTASHGLPTWLSTQLEQDWPDQSGDISQALRHSAPLFLRINRRVRGRDAYVQALHQADIDAAPTHRPDGVVLLESVNIPQLIGYTEGWFSVQDDHAQLCAELLGDLTGKHVLDACAAPGGKTAHLLEKFDVASLTALDSDAERLQRVHDNLARLQLAPYVPSLTIKATNAATWQAPQPFDAILLDAPCTATGVLRRHPDIRLLRKSEDVAQTVALQAKLLDHLWTQLAVGGALLYVTCSLLKAENEQQIAAFLARTPDAQEVKLDGNWGEVRPHGKQCFPREDGGGDGFYFAKLQKVS